VTARPARRWKVGDDITGEAARLYLPDGAELQHIPLPPFGTPGVIRTVGATAEGMGPEHRGIVGHATYRIRSLPAGPAVSRRRLLQELEGARIYIDDQTNRTWAEPAPAGDVEPLSVEWALRVARSSLSYQTAEGQAAGHILAAEVEKRRRGDLPEVACPSCGATIRARMADG
jgi:hypothetical protein